MRSPTGSRRAIKISQNLSPPTANAFHASFEGPIMPGGALRAQFRRAIPEDSQDGAGRAVSFSRAKNTSSCHRGKSIVATPSAVASI